MKRAKTKRWKIFKGKLKSMGRLKNNCELVARAGRAGSKKNRKKIKQDLGRNGKRLHHEHRQLIPLQI